MNVKRKVNFAIVCFTFFNLAACSIASHRESARFPSNNEDLNATSCNSKTESDHWWHQKLQTFIAAGGCLVQADSVSSNLIMAPLFIVTKLNDKALDNASGLKVFSTNSPVRSIILNLQQRGDVLFVVAPVQDKYAVVITEKTDPEAFKGILQQLNDTPNTKKVEIILALSNDVDFSTFVHEAKHVKDIFDKKLPIPKQELNSLNDRFNSALASKQVTAKKEEIDYVSQLVLNVYKSIPELSAAVDEYQFLLNRKEINVSFPNYIIGHDHPYISGDNGAIGVNYGLKPKFIKTNFMKFSAEQICEYLRYNFDKFSIPNFYEIYTSCKPYVFKKK